MMYDIIISENLRFCLFKGKRWANVFPNLHPQHRFQKPIFLVPKNIVHVWMEGYKNREKCYVFKNIQILVDRAWMITLPQGLAQVDQKHTLFCQQPLLGWNYQTIWIHGNQLLIELILIPFQLQNLPIYTRNRLDAFCCVNGLSYSRHLLRN